MLPKWRWISLKITAAPKVLRQKTRIVNGFTAKRVSTITQCFMFIIRRLHLNVSVQNENNRTPVE